MFWTESKYLSIILVNRHYEDYVGVVPILPKKEYKKFDRKPSLPMKQKHSLSKSMCHHVPLKPPRNGQNVDKIDYFSTLPPKTYKK